MVRHGDWFAVGEMGSRLRGNDELKNKALPFLP